MLGSFPTHKNSREPLWICVFFLKRRVETACHLVMALCSLRLPLWFCNSGIFEIGEAKVMWEFCAWLQWLHGLIFLNRKEVSLEIWRLMGLVEPPWPGGWWGMVLVFFLNMNRRCIDNGKAPFFFAEENYWNFCWLFGITLLAQPVLYFFAFICSDTDGWTHFFGSQKKLAAQRQ